MFPELAFPGPALGNILSQLGALCCVVCVFMVFVGAGVGRGDSCQSCSWQDLIRGDPSLGLTCTVGHPHTAHPSALSLCWLDGSVVANEPMWVPM